MLTKEQRNEFRKINAYAQVMFANGGMNYIAARCLLINNLLEEAAVLYCQAVEKALKGYIFLVSGNKSRLRTNEDKHNPYLLKEELKQCAGSDLGFDKYDDFLKHIAGHWHWRYHDSPNNAGKRSRTIGFPELRQWDEFWLFLFKSIPFPDEIKYQLTFPSMTLAPFILKNYPQTKFWLLEDNLAFREYFPIMEEKYAGIELG